MLANLPLNKKRKQISAWESPVGNGTYREFSSIGDHVFIFAVAL